MLSLLFTKIQIKLCQAIEIQRSLDIPQGYQRYLQQSSGSALVIME